MQLTPRPNGSLVTTAADYYTLLASFAQAIWETDPDGIVVTDSPSWRACTGQTLDSYLGEGWINAIHPDDRPYAMHLWKEAVAAQLPVNAEFRLQTPEGGWRWTNVRATRILRADGSIKKWLGINIDISEKKLGEEALKKQETRTRLAVKAAELATWEWDLRTDLVHWNDKHFELLGLPVREGPVYADTFLSHLLPDDAESIKAQLADSIRYRIPYDAEFRIVKEDGSVAWMSGYGHVTAEKDGRPVQASGVMFDISMRKKAELALQDASRRKDEFLAMLAHELRNPMATIRNGLTILELKASDMVAQTTINMMNRQTSHLVRMVDDLLDVGRITQGKIELRKKTVNLVTLARQAAESVFPLFQQEGKLLEVTLPPGPVELDGDATQLTQVMINLLTNGVRYTTDTGKVLFSLDHHAYEAVIRVEDNGIGIHRDELARIFDLFVQVDNSLARSRGGLGLGLTLVKSLVHLHGGRVEASSDGLGLGSSFTVTLPTLNPGSAALPETPARLLVIDDNDDSARTLSMLLQLKGYETCTENSGPTGIAAATKQQPAAIVMDIGMPGMDGFEACHYIREQPWGQNLVIIALTGYSQAADRLRSSQCGFDGHLVKPVDIHELTEMIGSLIKQKQTTTS
nr:PAS domain-containing protein [uncultured Arsenicibacter sp.]